MIPREHNRYSHSGEIRRVGADISLGQRFLPLFHLNSQSQLKGGKQLLGQLSLKRLWEKNISLASSSGTEWY